MQYITDLAIKLVRRKKKNYYNGESAIYHVKMPLTMNAREGLQAKRRIISNKLSS